MYCIKNSKLIWIFKTGFSFLRGSTSRQNTSVVKTLFTPASLGIIQFEYRKEKAYVKLADSKQSFKEKMKSFLENREDSFYVYTDDLKNMIYLCENNESDLKLLHGMAVRYNAACQENQALGFHFGPEFMRLLFKYNLANEAKQALFDEKLKGFFRQVSSYVIAMTLLYNAGHYQDVVQAMYKMMSERISINILPKANLLLTAASCYKMNTEESFGELLSLIKRAEDAGSKLDAKVMGFAGALALQRKRPEVAFELVSKAQNTKFVLQNIKAQALTQMGRPEETLPILRAIAEFPKASSSKSNNVLYAETVEDTERSLKENDKKEALTEFLHVKKLLQQNALIQEKCLDEMLCQPIALGGGEEEESFSNVTDRQKNRAILDAALKQGRHKKKIIHRKGFSNF